MSLERVIGFGGSNTDHVIFTKDCKEIVFPSHSLVVAMEIGDTRRQKIFMGHTDKVWCTVCTKNYFTVGILCSISTSILLARAQSSLFPCTIFLLM